MSNIKRLIQAVISPVLDASRLSKSPRNRYTKKFITNQSGMDFLGHTLKFLQPRLDGDAIDRINYYYTVSFLCVTALVASAKQFVGKPLQCWVCLNAEEGIRSSFEL